VRQALVLGTLQGPAELLPVSSSGHLVLLPALLGWPYAQLPGRLRKTVDVALHAGSAPVLAAVALRRLRGHGAEVRLLALTLAPPALAGLLAGPSIERRLGHARPVAAAQVTAGLALLLADRMPERARRPGAADHLAVGLGQAAALVPGVSRSGAAITAARLRGLPRDEAVALSVRAALPVTAAAGALKGAQTLRAGLPPGSGRPLAAGAAAACLSAAAALPLLERLEGSGSLAPLAAYRIALGAAGLLATHRRRDRRRTLA
jgi:undecaprenyl-diphosphatase